ncbi:mechanosensitive ion channel domain-containing protein [Buchnera aphidicola]|uniref:mechanosensitive ion channel domain-containing protein n=1 Tax=Buchnera aphidicola TaxID=9 RepID=UPI00223814B3|nr:mechanosensitive ion channel domain-containing protein [Buchnera aphidicola]MCW5197538.1 mechanosensitive ion channel [Buchnera aphidicola (Chaitophorus viminalis)]
MLIYILIILAIVLSLVHISNVQPTFFIAILGTLGMATGLTLQGNISNFTAGILLKIFRPFKLGEYVSLEKISGTVLNIDIFYTILRTIDGKIAVVPNNRIISGEIVNYSRAAIRRNEFFIHVAHNSDIKLVISVLKKVVNKEDRVIHNQDILIGLHELSPNSLNFVVRCWSKTIELQTVYWDLMYKFKKALDKNNIQIACSNHFFKSIKSKNINTKHTKNTK